ncbi:replication fork protection component Swi3-domain-containing protein [Gilbertella persicaria]|uniref:replication fork protection component Swi3-domain-containing protein n=1 Tax=Gilbertella persicaria TaxID=101096 RepID=UPI00221F6030|nr:replication fork protection component Swi3-domain-containing protein [Gilbertella persicaria]KAI8091090.1 replication fork protection component Swi3-domain-containing protein [Gilbertella persicaria]
MDEFDDILLDDYDIEQNINHAANTTTNPSPSTEQEVANEVSDKKPSQKRAKLDEERLLDTNGIYALKNRSQYLTFKGKGHEAKDLKNLMQFYMFWANNLFPKLKFQDFAKRVTKPASSARVKAVIKEWQDEYKERRQVRIDIDKELSGQGVQSEDEYDTSRTQEDDASSEDDNRPLFIPITKPLPANKPKAKKITRQQEEEPLFNSQQQQQQRKRKMVSLDDSEEEEEESAKSRQDILALLQQKRKKKEEAKKQEEKERALEKKNAELERADQDILQELAGDDIELELSSNELMELNIPSADNDQEMQDIE